MQVKWGTNFSAPLL